MPNTQLINELRKWPSFICCTVTIVKDKAGNPIYEKDKSGKPYPTPKLDKSPYNPKTKWYTEWGDPANRLTYEQAEQYRKAHTDGKCDCISYVLTIEDPYTCIDLDHCLDKATGKLIDEDARCIVTMFKQAGGTAIETSPSGTGLHIWCKAKLPDSALIKPPKESKYQNIEVYDKSHYITVTGKAFADEPVRDMQKVVDRILKDYDLLNENTPANGSAKPAAVTGSTTGSNIVTNEKYTQAPAIPLQLSDDEVISTIRRSDQGPKFSALYDRGDTSKYGYNQSKAEQGLFSILAYWTKDQAQMERIFLNSMLWKKRPEQSGRKKGRKYIPDSIAKALKKVEHGYSPKEYAAKRQAEELDQLVKNNATRNSADTSEPNNLHDRLIYLKGNEKGTPSDSDNANRLMKRCNYQYSYCPAFKSWIKWDGTKWAKSDKVEVYGAEERCIRTEISELNSLYRDSLSKLPKGETLNKEDMRMYAKVLQSLNYLLNDSKIKAAVSAAQSKNISYPDDFDKDPYLLNCDNGVLNLDTGELIPHSPDQKFMKCTAAAYTGKENSSLWRDTVEQIIPNPETRRYVQKMAGYFLTGSAKEEELFFIYGHSSSGKSTVFEQLGKAMGDYAKHIPANTLLKDLKKSDGERANPYIAGLQGARLTIANETSISGTFDDQLMKVLTGEDKVTARYLNANPVEFFLQTKIVLISNYAPTIRDISKDGGIFRRLVIIPFNAKITPNENLKEELSTPENLSDTLLWAVEGYRLWKAEGAGNDTFPPEVKKHCHNIMKITIR